MGKAVFRIFIALAVLAVCVWTVVQYLNYRAFVKRNPRAMAFCRAIEPGQQAQAVASSAEAGGALVVASKDSIVVRFPHESMCLAKVTNMKIESAAVIRND